MHHIDDCVFLINRKRVYTPTKYDRFDTIIVIAADVFEITYENFSEAV